MRWVFPDDPEALHAEISYFERAYVEVDDNGRLSYAEFHRTFGDWVRALRSAGFELEDVLEPEWPEGLATTWGAMVEKARRAVPGHRDLHLPAPVDKPVEPVKFVDSRTGERHGGITE